MADSDCGPDGREFPADRSGAAFDDRLAIDDALHALSNGRRRAVVQYLRESGDATYDVGEIADVVVNPQTPSRSSDPPVRDPEEVAALLRHRHLPKLDDHGIVAFDPADNVVSYRGDPVVEELLDTVQDISE